MLAHKYRHFCDSTVYLTEKCTKCITKYYENVMVKSCYDWTSPMIEHLCGPLIATGYLVENIIINKKLTRVAKMYSHRYYLKYIPYYYR